MKQLIELVVATVDNFLVLFEMFLTEVDGLWIGTHDLLPSMLAFPYQVCLFQNVYVFGYAGKGEGIVCDKSFDRLVFTSHTLQNISSRSIRERVEDQIELE